MLFAYNSPEMELKNFLSQFSGLLSLLNGLREKIHCQTPMEVQKAAYVPKLLEELTSENVCWKGTSTY